MKNFDAAREEFLEVMRRIEVEPVHVEHVARLALQLFDGLARWHGMGPEDRLLLEAAAHLHDIGWTVEQDGARHHKHSARLICEQTWTHFSPGEVRLMAAVARYHRKALPSQEHEEFARFSPREQARVEILASLLRVADALDRRHLQAVHIVEPVMMEDHLALRLSGSPPFTVEAAAVEKKGDLLRLLLKKDLRCAAARA